MSLVAEQWVGDWRLLEPLGQGGFAEVWRAQHSDGRLAALKVPSDPRFLDHLRRERATRQGAAAHPAIVGTLEDGLEHDPPYLALELVDGPSLRQRLERGPLSPQSVLDFVRDLAAALDGAHDQGVLHLDVKPGNVLFDSDGRVRLTDFGAGRAAVSDAELRQSLDFSRDLSRTGTPDYAAPELRFPAGAVDRRADVYSLAVVTYEALTGRPPLGLDRPSELRPELPQAVDPVLAKGLAQDPTRRPLSAGAFAGELAVALAESLAGEPGASGPTLAPAAPPARRSWSAGAARWLLLLALAALPLLALSSNEPDPLYQACAPLRAQLNAQGPAGGPVAVVLPPIDLGAAPGLAKVLRQRLPGALGLDDADALEWAPDDLEPEALWTPLGRQALGERGARQALYLVLPEGAERAEDARLFLARINPGLELIASSDWPRDRAA